MRKTHCSSPFIPLVAQLASSVTAGPKRHSEPKSDWVRNTCLLFDSCERKLPLSVL